MALKQATRQNQGGVFKCLTASAVVANPSQVLNYGLNYAMGKYMVIGAFGNNASSGDVMVSQIVSNTNGTMSATNPLAHYYATKTYILHNQEDNLAPIGLAQAFAQELRNRGYQVNNPIEIQTGANPSWRPFVSSDPMNLPTSLAQGHHVEFSSIAMYSWIADNCK